MAIKGEELALACANAADGTKAEDIRILDLRGLSSITDYMVVCTGTSMPQMRAIIRDVDKRVKEEHDTKALQTEGKADTRWVILDFVDVIVHVMDEEMRELYQLEELWKDAKEVAWEPTA